MTEHNPLAFIDEPDQKEQPPAPPPAEPVPGSEPAPPPPPPPPEPAPQPEAAHTVPLPKYLDAYNELREAKRKLEEVERKAKPAPELPDPVVDPDGYRQGIMAEVMRNFAPMIERNRLNAAEEITRGQLGNERVDAALKALEDALEAGDVWTYQRLLRTANPCAATVRWHEEQERLRTIGDDPDAWAIRRVQEIAAAQQQQAEGQALPGATAPAGRMPPPPQRPAAPPVPPPSLSRAPAAKKASDVPVGGGQAFDQAFRQ